MKFLLRLYPRSWRDRYEREFLETIHDRELSLADVIDIVVGALDAQLRAHRRAAGDEAPFSPEGRRIHLAAMLLLLAASVVLIPLLLPHLVPGLRLAFGASLSPYLFTSMILSGLAALGLLSGVPVRSRSLWCRQLGLVLIVVSVCGTAAVVSASFVVPLMLPYFVFGALPLMFNAGWTLFGIGEVGQRLLPSWVLAVLSIAALASCPGPTLFFSLAVLHPGVGLVPSALSIVAAPTPWLAASWIIVAVASFAQRAVPDIETAV